MMKVLSPYLKLFLPFEIEQELLRSDDGLHDKQFAFHAIMRGTAFILRSTGVK